MTFSRRLGVAVKVVETLDSKKWKKGLCEASWQGIYLSSRVRWALKSCAYSVCHHISRDLKVHRAPR